MTEAEILEMTYFDRCNIKRKVKIKDKETGITSTKLVTVEENIKCALNKKSYTAMEIDGVGKLVDVFELFTSPTRDIKAGDIVEILNTKNSAIYLASEPFFRVSHTVTPLSKKERA